MSEKRFFGFVEFGTWVRAQVTTLSEYLNLKLGEADTRLGEMDTKLLNKADQSALDLTNEAVATKANQNEVSDALATKLNVNAAAADSAALEGVTKATVIAEAVEAANLGTIASSDIYVSTVDPLPTDGKDGDLWIKYTP